MHRRVIFFGLFGLGLLLFVLSLVALFTAHGMLAWCVGFLYLAYDTWLLSRLIVWSRQALARPPAALSTPASRPAITVLIPARNEAPILPACLDAILSQEEPAEQIWIIDDGSEDDTRGMLARRYGLPLHKERADSERWGNLSLWSKPSSGKADSFNQILPLCSGDLIVTIDADTVIAPGSLAAIRRDFGNDSSLAAACGILSPRCRPGKWARYFEFFQKYEYLRAFLWRLAWSRFNALVLVSGAFAIYRRTVLEQIGGFDPGSWVEDYELLYRLHRKAGDGLAPWQVSVIPDARAITDAPSAPPQFLRQRSRWFGGFLSTLFTNSDMVGQRRYGAMGRILLPVKTIDTLLPFYAATAQIALLVFVFRGGFLTPLLISILAAKLFFDLCMHIWALRIFTRWLSWKPGWRLTAFSLVASLLEPFCFQPLRYTGALAGWLAFLRNRFSWESQRLAAPSSIPEA